eukprot:CAMPEP_0113899662 /NCGR_PEP_ID=MMETSP0780_2-20120614/20181_1 /TAXON_ID=652834 /ORGANISM="Palpitomonas bilix" /LENGTH=324 /DNA_ID=CAMNT_0000891905 /DNA_START=81 /DNA_END=1051 /DNA_ORIENTATION=+ /assembly_acc=CAM_ASM_000599
MFDDDLIKRIRQFTSPDVKGMDMRALDSITSSLTNEHAHNYDEAMLRVEERLVRTDHPNVALKSLILLHVLIRDHPGAMDAAYRSEGLRHMKEFRMQARESMQEEYHSLLFCYAGYIENFIMLSGDFNLDYTKETEADMKHTLARMDVKTFKAATEKVLLTARSLLMFQKEDVSILADASLITDYLYLDLVVMVPLVYECARICVKSITYLDIEDSKVCFSLFLEYGEVADRIHTFFGIFDGQLDSHIVKGVKPPPLPQNSSHGQVVLQSIVAHIARNDTKEEREKYGGDIEKVIEAIKPGGAPFQRERSGSSGSNNSKGGSRG